MTNKENLRADASLRRLVAIYEVKAPPTLVSAFLIHFIEAYFGSTGKFIKLVLWHKWVDVKGKFYDKLPFCLKPESEKEFLRQTHE